MTKHKRTLSFQRQAENKETPKKTDKLQAVSQEPMEEQTVLSTESGQHPSNTEENLSETKTKKKFPGFSAKNVSIFGVGKCKIESKDAKSFGCWRKAVGKGGPVKTCFCIVLLCFLKGVFYVCLNAHVKDLVQG